MNDKDKALSNIDALLKLSTERRGKPGDPHEAELLAMLEARLFRVSQMFTGMKRSEQLLAQLNAAMGQAVRAFCDNHQWHGEYPSTMAISCEHSLDVFHIVLIPAGFTGTRSYDCGCQVHLRDGYITEFPQPPSVSDAQSRAIRSAMNGMFGANYMPDPPKDEPGSL